MNVTVKNLKLMNSTVENLKYVKTPRINEGRRPKILWS